MLRCVAVLLVFSAAQAMAQNSFWTADDLPHIDASGDRQSVNVGLRFSVDVVGLLKSIRFYRGPGSAGPHLGLLWTESGEKLAEVEFESGKAPGWQEAALPCPVVLVPETTYVVSYFAPYGRYAYTGAYRWSGLETAPLRVSGEAPGVFTYSDEVAFPKQSYNDANYWVDVGFSPTDPEALAPNVTGEISGGGATVSLWGRGRGSDDTEPTETRTDEAGRFEFINLAADSYFVTPREPGVSFTPVTALVQVGCGVVPRLRFEGAAAPDSAPQRAVYLRWHPSPSKPVPGYNVYRSDNIGGPYTKVNDSMIRAVVYVDTTVEAGRTYYYVATAESIAGESAYSEPIEAIIPAS